MSVDNRIKTLVIPTYTLNKDLETMAFACALSHRDQVDEIIITEDGGNYSDGLREIADIYIYNKHNVGFTRNLNRGWILSNSDFTIIANSDTVLVSGNLSDICRDDPPMVCSPGIENLLMRQDGFTGSYFVVPKEIKKKYGMLDERLKNYQSDIDYYYRIKDLFLVESRVIINHQKAQTIVASDLDIKIELNRDAQMYDKMLLEEYPERIIRQ